MLAMLSPHFSLDEFCRSDAAIRHGLDNHLPDLLIPNAIAVCTQIERIRAHYGRAVFCTSGYRSPEVNRLIGGSPTSDHCQGRAMDFHVDGVSNRAVLDLIRSRAIDDLDWKQVIYEYPNAAGEPSWCHLSYALDPALNICQALVTPKSGTTQYRILAVGEVA